MSISDNPIFDPRHALAVHILELLLVTVIIVLTIVRMTDDVPFTRGQIMCLTMGAKSTLVIIYQLLTKHVASLRKFGNNFASAILNLTEIATWPVAIAFLFLGNSMVCVGDSCTIQWVITVLALVLFVVAIQAAVSSCLDFIHHRRYNVDRGQEPIFIKK